MFPLVSLLFQGVCESLNVPFKIAIFFFFSSLFGF